MQQVVQERGERLAALGSCCWYFHKIVLGLSRMVWIFIHRITIGALGMTARCEQLRMVKRRCLIYRALISQGVAQEINQILLVLQGQAKDLDIRVHVLNFWNCIEVAAAVVELNHLLQSQLTAVVEIRSSQSDVAQLWRLKEPGPG